MSNKHQRVEPIANADSKAVVSQYGEFGAVYAETRAKVARSLGREQSARKWREVETEIAAVEDNKS